MCLNGNIDETISASIVAQLLVLEADNPEKQIHLYINTPGGSVTAGSCVFFLVPILPSDHKPFITYLCFLMIRPCNLRYDDIHCFTSQYHMCGTSGIDGFPPPVRWPSRETLLPSSFFDHGASALGGLFRTGFRYCNPCKRDPTHPNPAE